MNSISRAMNLRSRLAAVLGVAALAVQAHAQTPKAAPAAPKAAPATTQVATFAGGCFWCMEPPYDKLDGVLSTTSGFMGGKIRKPTYEEVTSGRTGHAEVVQVVYDPTKVSYDKLLEVFWKNIDPTVKDRQFCDTGSHYRTAIFVHNDEQKQLAEKSLALLSMTKPFKDPIVTPVVVATDFWPAEEYHQDYYLKNPVRYNYYRTGCGRDARLKALWGSAPQ